MEGHCGRCCNHLIGYLADADAKVADRKPHVWMVDVVVIVADGIAT